MFVRRYGFPELDPSPPLPWGTPGTRITAHRIKLPPVGVREVVETEQGSWKGRRATHHRRRLAPPTLFSSLRPMHGGGRIVHARRAPGADPSSCMAELLATTCNLGANAFLAWRLYRVMLFLIIELRVVLVKYGRVTGHST